MKQKRMFLTAVSLAFVLSFAVAPRVFAAELPPDTHAVSAFINGVSLKGPKTAAADDAEVYVPLRALMEMIGFEVTYDSETRTVSFDDGDTSITFALKSGIVKIDGVDFDRSEYRLIDGNLFVPLSFITDYFNRAALFIPEYKTDGDGTTTVSAIKIFSAYSVQLDSDILVSSLTYNYSEDLDENGHVVTSQYAIPQFAGFGGKTFETSLNKTFSDIFYDNEQNILDTYKEISESAADEIYSYASDMVYSFQYGDNGTFAVLLDGYDYAGGAHGLETRSSYVIDQAASKLLSLADVFKPDADYKEILAKEMNKIRDTDSEDWEIVNEITANDLDSYDGYNFYFSGSELVIYYNPYDIAPYARGLVEFKIPSESLAPYLLEKYLG
ncbi:MAG: DUF3298 domain-containing protein [Clostridiales bacterium]|nr:DUF3298 domain-containing protein [Clostridiales bacterium]